MYGTDWEYANTRLAGTVVRVGDEPVMVDNIRPDCIAEISYLNNFGPIDEVALDNLNLKPVNLGMVNISGRVAYLTRLPMRRDWKQGLRKTNFISLYYGRSDIYTPTKLREVILGLYPTYQDAVAKIGRQSTAWHRHWAIRRDGFVLYKSFGIVGTVVVGGIVQLSKEYSYLQQALEESL